MGDWDLLARLTTEPTRSSCRRSPPTTRPTLPHRHLGRPDRGIDAEIVRRRARAAHGLDRPAGPPAGGALLRSLHDRARPLQLDGWALSAPALEALLTLVPAGDPLVVECGSGESTIAIARLLRARGGGRLQALEHYPAWAGEVRRRLEAEGLDRWTEVIDAPLTPNPFAEPGCEWYSPAAVERLGEPIDLLLVDGPPGGEPGRERSRYPALPVLGRRLAPGATVVLDDAARSGERWVLERWQAEAEIGFERIGDELAVGRVGAGGSGPRGSFGFATQRCRRRNRRSTGARTPAGLIPRAQKRKTQSEQAVH